ncbi:MAG: DNA polymerase III subunit gamma/tau [Armatimonadetes bacterium]|nr:DNA polymerase III subunit gamma/tau [Armatimonadota bacterium]
MAYVSLYRKYRSQTFDDVIGQDHVIRTVRNAIRAGRIAQGYLFCGSRGTGKTTVARLIAKALNCTSTDGPTPDPCGVCDACLSITEGSAVDVIEMDAASNRGVDDVDALRDGVKYHPMQFRYKVYIIDEAHQLSAQAKDAFLKTLEEPPPHAVFILATTESQKIPITIRSRCQQFDFRRGSIEEITGRLKHVSNGEQAQIDDFALDIIARSANGSYRDSLSLLEQVIAYSDGAITSKEVYTVLGAVDEDVLLELGEVLASTDTGAAFAIADRLLREGKDVRELLKSSANHFRDVLALKVGADEHHKADERWRDQAEAFTQERLVRIIDSFSAAEKDLKWNEQHRLALEMALLRAMVKPREAAPARESAPVEATVSAPRREEAPVAPPTPKPAPKPARAHSKPVEKPAEVSQPVAAVVADDTPINTAPSEPVTVSIGEVQREWQKILKYVQKVLKQPQASACARESRPLEIEGNVLKLGFAAKWDFHRNIVEANASWFEQGLADIMGARLKVTTVLLDDAPEVLQEEAAASEPIQHPLQNDILTMFDATIVDSDTDPWEE